MIPDLTSFQHREISTSLSTRAKGDGDREFTGIGVPYGVEIDLGYWRERFEPGSIEGAETALVMHQHRDTIGKVTGTAETDAGIEITGRISQTSLGDDVYTLMRDGVLTKLSIGFQPIEHRIDVNDKTGEETVVWTKVRAREFSVVAIPAYDTAEVSTVRSAPSTSNRKATDMSSSTLTREDLDPINDAITKLERSLASLGSSTAPVAPQFRSMGQFVKALATGDETAAAFHRDYTGGTVDDGIVKNSVVGTFIKLVEDRRRLMSRFSRATLPDTGMSVDYYQLASTDIKVGKQTGEGTDLPGPSKITLKEANSPVSTIGGWTEISRQAIERATVPAIDTTLKAMALKYAAETEAGLRTVYTSTIKAQADAGNAITVSAAAGALTAADWVKTLIQAVEKYDTSGFKIDGLDLSADLFAAVATLTDTTGRPLFNIAGQPVNALGTIDLGTLSGDLAGIRASLLPGAAEGTAAFYDNEAIQSLESPGAPAQLQDETIISLTKQFSLYGYCAYIVPFPAAIVPVKFSA